MKKKLFTFSLVLILCVCFTACTKSDKKDIPVESSTDKINESEASVTPSPDELFETTFSINGETYRLPMWYKDFNPQGLELKDAPDTMLFSNQTDCFCWVIDDLGFDGHVFNGSINSKPIKDCLIQKFDIMTYGTGENTEVLFPRNIRLNVSTKEDILAAYGEPTEMTDSEDYIKLFYQSDKDETISVAFFIDKNINLFNYAKISNETLVEGFDNTLSSDVPYVFDYVAPTQLSDTLDMKVFKVNDQYYSLPCPVSEFINNGFEISKYCKDFIIPSGGSKQCRLELDGKTLYAYATNFSHYATSIYSCHITLVENTFEGDANIWVAEFSPGFKLGDTEEQLLTILNGKYKKFKNDDSVTYHISTYDWQGMWPYSITLDADVANGVVTFIYFQNEQNPAYTE